MCGVVYVMLGWYVMCGVVCDVWGGVMCGVV